MLSLRTAADPPRRRKQIGREGDSYKVKLAQQICLNVRLISIVVGWFMNRAVEVGSLGFKLFKRLHAYSVRSCSLVNLLSLNLCAISLKHPCLFHQN